MSDIVLQVIENDDDLEKALARIDEIWGAEIGSPLGNELDNLIKIVGDYENINYCID